MTYKIKFENYPGFIALYAKVLMLLFMLGGGFHTQAQQPIYIAHSDNTYKVLQVADNSQSNGTSIVLGDRNDGKTSSNQAQQEWYYDEATMTIRLKTNPNKCLARKGQPLPNDPIVLADYSPNNEAQRWVMEDNKIKLWANKILCIGLSNYNYNQGNTAVLQEISIGGAYQKWFFREKPTQIMMTADGQLHRVDSQGETYIEYAIPDPCPYKFLNISARGGDGGIRSVHNIITGKEDIKAKGGEGATIWGSYKIGAGAGELKPGTVMRFIIGRAGTSNRNNGASCGAAGGGGTGVVYETSAGQTGDFYYPWEILMVAGGGGGAYSDAAAIHSDGKPAEEIDKTGSGLSYGEPCVCGGGYRQDLDPNIPLGGGAYYYNSHYRSGFNLIDEVIYPTGAKCPGNTTILGGFGFGAGGQAYLLLAGTGGGYTGGKASETGFQAGAGGTSFVSKAASERRNKNSVTANPADGYIEYLFNDGPATRDLYFECHKGTEVEVLKTGAWTLLWQYDGNLVLYGPGFPNGAWASNTAGTDLIFQGDGNLVIYQSNASPWSTDTPDDHHGGKGGRKLVLTPEGGLYITDQDGKAIWTGR